MVIIGNLIFFSWVITVISWSRSLTPLPTEEV